MATLLGSSAEGTTDQGGNGNKKSPDTIGFKDIYTIVFVISTFPVELAQVCLQFEGYFSWTNIIHTYNLV